MKQDDGRLRSAPFGSRSCTLCANAAYESANHMIMQCSFNEDKRAAMFNEIEAVYPNLEPADAFSVIMVDILRDAALREWCRYGKLPAIILSKCTMGF